MAKKALCLSLLLCAAAALFGEAETLFTTDNEYGGRSILTLEYDRIGYLNEIYKVRLRLLNFDRNKNQVLQDDTFGKGTVTIWGGDDLLLNGRADWDNGAIVSDDFDPENFFYKIDRDLDNITEIRFNVDGDLYNFIRADSGNNGILS